MIEREYDAARINAVVNHPAVHPWVALPGQGEIDLSEVVADRRNVLLMIDGGGIVFMQHEPGVYEAHTQFVPEVRGKAAFRATREAVHYMFTRTDCMELLTQVPGGNVAAESLARRIGSTLQFERENAWQSADGPKPVKYFALRYPEWVKEAPGLVERGHWFHERLEAEKARWGSQAVVHDDDPAHDRHVGAALEMLFGGQIAKGLVLYNRWARFAGYVELQALSADPVIIDIQEAVLQFSADNFEVIQCR